MSSVYDNCSTETPSAEPANVLGEILAALIEFLRGILQGTTRAISRLERVAVEGVAVAARPAVDESWATEQARRALRRKGALR